MKADSKLSIYTVCLHWFVGIFMVVSVILGIVVAEMARTPTHHQLMNIHKSVGVLVLFVAALRILWRRYEGHYEVLGHMSKLQAKGVAWIHWLLLALTIVMPISGLMISIGGGYPVSVFGVPFIGAGEANELLGNIGRLIHSGGMILLITLIVLHILGTLKYQFIDNYPIVSRMLGKKVKR